MEQLLLQPTTVPFGSGFTGSKFSKHNLEKSLAAGLGFIQNRTVSVTIVCLAAGQFSLNIETLTLWMFFFGLAGSGRGV
jgi:hypothetical protein